MGQIEWAMWANESAVISSVLMFFGGIVGVAGLNEFKYWQAAVAAVLISILLFLLEWPRGKRKKGSTIERLYQSKLTPVISRLGFISKNYFSRFILHVLCSVPSCFLLSTLIAGVSAQISALIYLVAALKGEEWSPCMPKKEENGNNPQGQGQMHEPPQQPPPRRPDQVASGCN